MSAYDAILTIKVVTDATQAAAGLDKAEAAGGRFGNAMRKAALPAAAIAAGVVAIGKKAVDAASNLQQADGAVEAVFGNAAGAVKEYAKTADTSMGLSAAAYQNYAALVGTALQNAGFTAAQSVEESNKVMQRGADLAALYGGTTADAVEAINAAVSRSEFDPLEKYGVSLNMTAVNAELAAKGQDKLTGAALETAKKQLILQKIYDGTSKAAGQYAREADSVAGRTQTAAAQWENAAAALGKVLLPVVAKVTAELAEFGEWAEKNTTTVQVFVGILGGLAAAVLVVNGALKVYQATMLVYTAVTKAATAASLGTRVALLAMAAAEKIAAAAQWALNAALSANPIGLIVIAIVALVAGLVLAYKKSETFRNIVNRAFDAVKRGAQAVANFVTRTIPAAFSKVIGWIKANWKKIVAILTGPVGIAVYAIIRNWSKIRAAFSTLLGWIKSAWKTAWSLVVSIVRTYISTIRSLINGIRDAVKGVASFITSTFVSAWKTLQRVATTAINAIKNPIETLKSLIDRVVDAISRIKFPSAPSWLSKVPGLRSLSATAGAPTVAGVASRAVGMSAAPMVASPRAGVGATGVGTGSGVNIVVNGALDPEAVARQIRRILAGHDRRIGLQTA